MINKIKIWLNRNFIKAFLIIFLVWLFYSFINSLNLHYKEKKEKRQELFGFINVSNIEESDEEELEDDEAEAEKEEEELIDKTKSKLVLLDKNSEEYKKIFTATSKIINLMYQLNLNSNLEDIKNELYNLYTEELIIREQIDINNIKDYCINIDDTQNYSVDSISRYNEENNVISYILKLNHKIEDEGAEELFIILDVDYNTNSFAYDGEIESLDEIPFIEFIDKVERNSTNSFE